MEPKDRQEEEEPNETNNLDSAQIHKAGIERWLFRATTLNSSHTNVQDPVMHIFHSKSNSAIPTTKREDSFSHDGIKKSRSKSVENSSINTTSKTAGEPQFMKLPFLDNSRIGAIPVLPIRNILRNVEKCCISPDAITDQFSTNKYHQSKRINDYGSNLNIVPVSGHSSDFSSIKTVRSCEIVYPVENLRSTLNVAKQSLRHLNDNENIPLLSSKSSKLTKMSLNSALETENTNDKETRFVKQRIKDMKSLIVNIAPDRCRNLKTSITTNDKDNYLDNTRDNEDKIKDISERSLLTNKNEDAGGAAEPFYETIEDESNNEYKIQNQQERVIPKMDVDKNKHSETCDGNNQTSLGNIQMKLEEQDALEIQRFESFHSTSIGTLYKIEDCEYKDDMDEKNFGEMWINYADRPLLPLKLTHKQRSLSCSNLVQTIKGFSKRNSADNNRFLSVDTTGKSILEPTEICASEAVISKECRTKVSQLQDFEPRGDDNVLEPSAAKSYPWYHEVDAKEASKRLLSMQQDGVFLIRPASNPTKYILHTLCVTYDACVYNMYIRHMNGLIALGKKKEKEKTFSSILEMIRYHQNVPISIHLAQVGKSGKVYLLITPPK